MTYCLQLANECETFCVDKQFANRERGASSEKKRQMMERLNNTAIKILSIIHIDTDRSQATTQFHTRLQNAHVIRGGCVLGF